VILKGQGECAVKSAIDIVGVNPTWQGLANYQYLALDWTREEGQGQRTRGAKDKGTGTLSGNNSPS
jgi:hypothetical protein